MRGLAAFASLALAGAYGFAAQQALGVPWLRGRVRGSDPSAPERERGRNELIEFLKSLRF